MGTDMRARLEYNQTGKLWLPLSNWELIRDWYLYHLLGFGHSEDAIYSPRGLPPDAGYDARRAYFMSVVETEDGVRRLEGRVDAISRADAEHAVARGWSEWFDFHGHRFVNDPEAHDASWLTATEFRQVVDYYRAHIREIRIRHYEAILARQIERYGEEEGRKLASTLRVPPDESHDFLHPEYRMLLAAMEAGEAAGLQVRLIFWFQG